MSWWFLRFSPTGAHVAGGHLRIQEDGIDIGPGTNVRYADDDTLFYTRQPDGAFMRWDRQTQTSVVVRFAGFNFFDVAPDGRWVGYRADPPRLIWHDAGQWIDFADGDISNTRWAARRHADSSLYAGTGNGQNGQLVDRRACSDVRLLGDVLVWRVNSVIFGQRRHGDKVEDWSIEGEEHFWPVPVMIGDRLFILTHTQNRLLLYEAITGQTQGYVINEGISDFPDVVALDNHRVRIGWTDKGEKHERILNINTATLVDLRPPLPEWPVEDTSGNAIDPLKYMFGSLLQRDGDHEMCWHVDQEKKRWYEIKFGNIPKPRGDAWEAYYWTDTYIGLFEDRSQSEPNYNPPWDYAFTADVWVMRPTQPGQGISHPTNRLIRFDPRTNQAINLPGMHYPYYTRTGRMFSSFPFGGDVGTCPALEIELHAEGTNFFERNTYALNVGRCIWEVIDRRTGLSVHSTRFIYARGPALTPTIGGRESMSWPPPERIVGMTITSFLPEVILPLARATANPNPGEEWSDWIEWVWRPEGTKDWIQQDDRRNPRDDNDHTFRFPGIGRYEIGVRWASGQTAKKRLVVVKG